MLYPLPVCHFLSHCNLLSVKETT
uniref:Uncharacterized protein n=1 Tax=Arundo donax TaxID=35708 RepID=A0A0A8Z4C8_ARUDO